MIFQVYSDAQKIHKTRQPGNFQAAQIIGSLYIIHLFNNYLIVGLYW